MGDAPDWLLNSRTIIAQLASENVRRIGPRSWRATRAGEGRPQATDPATLLAGMVKRLAPDSLWSTEYQDYVRQVSFAHPGELIGFDADTAA